tara:strand:+ start:79 stop:285 length:207 start_codon:yes stop_codon:yes gene_type:complete
LSKKGGAVEVSDPRETYEEEKKRLAQARRRGWDAGKRGDPIWYNPNLKKMAEKWREGWKAGAEKKNEK